MKVDDFIQGYEKALKSKSAVNNADKYLEKHVVKKYIPYSVKMAEAHNIILRSSFDVDNKFYINSPLRYILFIVSVFTNYTDIEFDASMIGAEYDKLAENNVIDPFIEIIGDDYGVFQTVVNMTLDDFIENERSFPSFLEHGMEAIKSTLEGVDFENLISSLNNNNA